MTAACTPVVHKIPAEGGACPCGEITEVHRPQLAGGPGTAGPRYRSGRRLLRAESTSYGCRVELRVDHAAVVTEQELDRALAIACEQVRARFAATTSQERTDV